MKENIDCIQIKGNRSNNGKIQTKEDNENTHTSENKDHIRRQVLTARVGQGPTHWVDWEVQFIIERYTPAMVFLVPLFVF